MSKKNDQSHKVLREYHKMGKIVLREPGKLSKAEQSLMEQYGTLNEDTKRKVAYFADPKRGFSEEDLEKLINLCDGHSYVMGFSIVGRLLAVPKPDRHTVQKKIAENGWSRRDLDLWIQANYGSRTTGGRHPKRFASSEALAAGILTTCHRWLRQHDSIERTNAIAFEQLSPEIRKQFNQVSRLIQRLYDELVACKRMKSD